MDKQVKNQYNPDVVSPPGETLLELLQTLGITQVELSERIGKSPKHINKIIKGEAPIVPETALQLEHALRVPAQFWNNRERRYREFLAYKEERERMQEQVEWLERLPLQTLQKWGWIEKFDDAVDQLREVLSFFGVVSPKQWEVLWLQPEAAFRQSPVFKAEPYAVAAWLRKGELEAQQVDCAPFNKKKFKAALREIRSLTGKSPQLFQQEIVRLSAEAGVAVVFVPALDKTRASGATRWLKPDKALIQLSLRYKSDDQFWFTFFHEAAHILHHSKREVFIDVETVADDEREREANKFAADFLISPEDWRRFARQEHYYSREEILDFAATLDVAPGIVVGRLQHEDYLDYKYCNSLKRKLTWQMEEGRAIIIPG